MLAKSSRLFVVIVPAVAAASMVVDASIRDTQLRLGKPAVWTLEQAHYLLARQRRTNLDLETKALTGEDLNPNAVNSSRLDALQTLFGLQVGVDSERGIANKDVVARRDESQRQRKDLTRQLSTYRSQELKLVREIGKLQIDASGLDADSQKGDLAVKNAEIAAKQTELTLVQKRIADTSALLSDTDKQLDASLDLKPFTGAAAGSLPESTVAKALNDAMDTGASRIHASAALDNYIQMQYELIAKQLSLLRDDVGTENRLVFLELPASVYTSPKAEDVLIRTSWQIQALVRCKSSSDQRPIDTLAPNWDQYKKNYEEACRTNVTPAGTEKSGSTRVFERSWNLSAVLGANRAKAFDALKAQQPSPDSASVFIPVLPATTNNTHVVDLFPRQAALNVNTVHDSVNRISLSGLWSLIGGFGAKTQFERQHELFENYIQQDIFASGYGKGDTTFGWTFGPLPGSRQVSSGVKVTYAAVLIPKDVQALSLQGSICPLKRKGLPLADPFSADAAQQGCTSPDPFFLTLPAADEGFAPTEVRYSTVTPAQTATMFLTGDYFSPQIGILVDGSPLKARALGLAQTDLDQSLAVPSDEHFTGEFEYVSSRILVLRIKGSDNYSGTPRISLITPSSARELNDQRMTINGAPSRTFAEEAANGNGLFRAALSIEGMRLANIDTKVGDVTVDLGGTGFGRLTQFAVNGVAATPVSVNDHAARIRFVPHGTVSWDITGQESGPGSRFASYASANLLLLKKTGGEVIADVPAVGKESEHLIIKLVAQTMNDRVDTVSVVGGTLDEDTVAMAPGELVIEVSAPQSTVLVRLDRVVGDWRQTLTWTFNRQKGRPDTWTVK
jgi:hypothetical protein